MAAPADFETDHAVDSSRTSSYASSRSRPNGGGELRGDACRQFPASADAWSDNRATSHFGRIDGPQKKEQRIVHRTTVGGDLPVGPDGFVSKPPAGDLFNVTSW